MSAPSEWIEWAGADPEQNFGHMSPPDYNGGPIKYRCGQIDPELTNRYKAGGDAWRSAEWRHDGEAYDIVAYQVVHS